MLVMYHCSCDSLTGVWQSFIILARSTTLELHHGILRVQNFCWTIRSVMSFIL